MEEVLQLLVRCFPIATFLLAISTCTNKSKNFEKRRPGKQLTLSVSSMSSMSHVEEPVHVKSFDEVEDRKVEDRMEEDRKEEDPKETDRMEESDERQAACGNPPEKKAEEVPVVPKKEEVKMEQEMILNETNPHFAYLLNSDRNSDTAEFSAHARTALEQTAAFQWTLKKRLSFDEGCWKHLSRRISCIRAEGFEVRVNTRQARENKLNNDRETAIDRVFMKWAAAKPQKKKGGE